MIYLEDSSVSPTNWIMNPGMGCRERNVSQKSVPRDAMMAVAGDEVIIYQRRINLDGFSQIFRGEHYLLWGELWTEQSGGLGVL